MLDSNGYAPSIVHKRQDRCYLCGIGGDLARHEPLDGIGRRKKSKALGLWVCLCPSCHDLSHRDRRTQDILRAECEEAALREYGWTITDFIAELGKNYI